MIVYMAVAHNFKGKLDVPPALISWMHADNQTESEAKEYAEWLEHVIAMTTIALNREGYTNVTTEKYTENVGNVFSRHMVYADGHDDFVCQISIFVGFE